MYETTNWQALGSFLPLLITSFTRQPRFPTPKLRYHTELVRYDNAILGANNLTMKPTDSGRFLVNMGSAAREADMDAMTQNGHTDESTSPMVLLPPEIKTQIMSHLGTQESLSYLGQSCRVWHEVANEELYKRDSRENDSFAIKWMAAHAVDEQTTDFAIRTLEISRQWGGQIDAVKPRLSPLDEARSDNKDQIMYDTSTALHFAVFLGNMRLTKTLLDMEASLTIPCSKLIWKSMGSEKVLRRANYFRCFFKELFNPLGPVLPLFLAFLQSDTDMCELLVEHGAGREAMIFDIYTNPKAMSILHFAAADPTTDYRQWRCLFDRFREHIDEPSPRLLRYTPLHIALDSGCTEGMQILVESGADKEARDGNSRTPLSVGVTGIICYEDSNLGIFDERTMCFRKFVELGANVNPEGNSVLVSAVWQYAGHPVVYPLLRPLIYFLLDHHADMHGTLGSRNINVLDEIIKGILNHDHDPPTQELLKGLLGDFIDRGLNLTTPAPGLPSPLYFVLSFREANPEWLFDLLCDKGATIHEYEVNTAFFFWCEISRLWERNGYDWWWKHQGQEDKFFLKWCEHPYNAWWWQHVKQISAHAAIRAYGAAFKHKDRLLYDILTHLPLPAPLDGLLVILAFNAFKLWSWRLVGLREFEDDFLATWSSDKGENMIHLTVRKYHAHSCYSAADAVLDVLHLRDKGVNMSSPNSRGQTPLDLFLKMGTHKRRKDDFLELVALVKGNIGVQGVLETTTLELRKMTLF